MLQVKTLLSVPTWVLLQALLAQQVDEATQNGFGLIREIIFDMQT
jgi:hypothetical protein